MQNAYIDFQLTKHCLFHLHSRQTHSHAHTHTLAHARAHSHRRTFCPPPPPLSLKKLFSWEFHATTYGFHGTCLSLLRRTQNAYIDFQLTKHCPIVIAGRHTRTHTHTLVRAHTHTHTRAHIVSPSLSQETFHENFMQLVTGFMEPVYHCYEECKTHTSIFS